jgi:lysophospholipase L1-like esterase
MASQHPSQGASSSGLHDRRGFETPMKVMMTLMPVSVLLMIFYSVKVGFVLLLLSCVFFIGLEVVSARPDNNPATFQKWIRRIRSTTNRNCPVLLCYGDSITHGNCSASYTPELPLVLCRTLGLPIPDRNQTFADPLWVVNAGQNMITSHTIAYERLPPTLNAVSPDFVLIFIGTNDVQAIYKPKSWGRFITYINQLPQPPSLPIYEQNIRKIIRHIEETSSQMQIGIVTLPPMGENLQSRSNQVVRQANEVLHRIVNDQKNDKVTIIPLFESLETILEKEKPYGLYAMFVSFDQWRLYLVFQSILFHLTYGALSWNLLSRWMCGYHVLSDGIHLNERGAAVLVDLIVQWLVQKNITKAIAVKKG